MAEITKVEATETGGIAVVTPADEAAGKLDSEIKDSKNESAKAIVEYLKKRARESENLANDILKPSKTWNKCWEYIYSKAAKLPREGRVQEARTFRKTEEDQVKDSCKEAGRGKTERAGTGCAAR